VSGVKELAGEWPYDVVALGYPGLVLQGHVVAEPHNLGSGWVRFDFAAAFGCPVKLINDAAMQALGSYQGGVLLFLGLGIGLGAALVTDGIVTPMELGTSPTERARTRTMWASGDSSGWAGRNGSNMSKTGWRT